MISLKSDDIDAIYDDISSLGFKVSRFKILQVLDCYSELRARRLLDEGVFNDGDFTYSMQDGKVSIDISDSFIETYE